MLVLKFLLARQCNALARCGSLPRVIEETSAHNLADDETLKIIEPDDSEMLMRLCDANKHNEQEEKNFFLFSFL